jgi:hypothetical protein
MAASHVDAMIHPIISNMIAIYFTLYPLHLPLSLPIADSVS